MVSPRIGANLKPKIRMMNDNINSQGSLLI